MFAAYLDRLYSPIDALNALAVSLQQNVAHLGRAMNLLETGPVEEAGKPLRRGPGQVEFRDVHFAYNPDRPVLRGLNLTLEAGKITALVGPSGAGKTTMADLMLKLFEPVSGQIFFDGQDLRDADPSAVRAAIGVVSADGSVFRGTLGSNIRYKRPDATDAEVIDAAQTAGLTNLLQRLPQGIDTPVGETGVGLSLGERQRLQIARILVDRPRILVLDEATANLDFATEQELRGALTHLSPPATILVIAHRYTMAKDAACVYVLQDGVVAESGAPETLIASGGWFAEMAHQAGEEDIPTEAHP
jgi:ABC-type multidrug transport system fused ATPase/permease subunit